MSHSAWTVGGRDRRRSSGDGSAEMSQPVNRCGESRSRNVSGADRGTVSMSRGIGGNRFVFRKPLWRELVVPIYLGHGNENPITPRCNTNEVDQ